MATTHEPRPDVAARPPIRRRSGPFRWTAEQVYKLSDLGFFDGRRVELLEGILYESTINPPHAVSVGLATSVLTRRFGAGYSIRVQQPLDLGRRNQPEPDLAVATGNARDYSGGHPKTALLVVEVSETTLRKDRTIKNHIYAQAGITDYWIVNLVDRRLEVHRGPGPDPSREGRFRYADVTIVPADGRALPLAAPGSDVAVADLLP